ncbi:MAG: hypothetical protein SGPRY_006556 [Prymnesium sp.]
MQDVFCIVKCASQNPYDLSRTFVLKNLTRDNFSAENGWELNQWARDMALPASKKKNEAGEAVLECDVIKVQNNARMDSPEITMWCDLQFEPRMQAMRVRKVFDEWGVTVKELPPKMTDLLQVMDLVVKGPIKASIRKNSLETEKFKQSMRKTYVKVGHEVETFAVYAAHKKAGWLTNTIFGEVHVNEIIAHKAKTAVLPKIGVIFRGQGARISSVTKAGRHKQRTYGDGGGNAGAGGPSAWRGE